MARSDDDIHSDEEHPQNPPLVPPQTQQILHTVSSIKLPILKKGEYDIWAMKIEHYLGYIDYPIWQVIQNGNGHVSVTTDTNGVIKILPPKIAKQVLDRERERKAKTTLLMALPEDHLAKFHKMTDAKEMFQTLLSQIEIHGVGVSNEDANQKFLRSLPPFWSQVALIMRTKPGIDTLSFDDLYKNLRVFKNDVKGTQNSAVMAYTSSNLGSNNKVKSYSKVCKDTYAKLKKLHDDQREKLRDASVEITAYTLALKKVKAQLLCRQQNQLAYEQKIRLGYGDHRYGSILSYENEVLQSVFINKAIDLERPVNDRYAEGMHAVPPLMTGNYMPSRLDVEIDYSKFTYGPKQTKADESDAKSSEYASCETNSSVDIPKSMPTPVENVPKIVCEPKVFSHLIRDCDFHEKRMARQVDLTKSMNKVTGKRENRPVWNNVQRVNHKNKFVPSAVIINTGRLPVNTARQNFSSQAASTSTARKVTTSRTFVNETRPKSNFHKSHSPHKRPFNSTTASKTNFSNQKANIVRNKSVSDVRGKKETAVKTSVDYDPHRALKDKGIVDSGCSMHMTGNKAHLADYRDFKGGTVAFRGSFGRIIDKGNIKTSKLDFENVYFVKELKHYNLFSVSQMCDKKNKVLFTDTECLMLSSDFKLHDENQVLLKIPRQHNMYSFNLKNIDPSGDLDCLIAKATIDESNKWHRMLGHVNFKNLNKLVKGNLVRGLPFNIFENNHTCVACQKGKQHKASYKAKLVSSMNQPLQILHMDLFGPTSVRSINHKTYYLVITDGFSRFSWVYFLRSKDETTPILKDIIRQAENQFNRKQRIKLTHLQVQKKLTIMQDASTSSTNLVKTASTPVNTASTSVGTASPLREFSVDELSYPLPNDPSMPNLEDIHANPREGIFVDSSYDAEGVVTDFNNLETTMNVSPTPTTRIHSIIPKTQILGDPKLAIQTRSKVKHDSRAHAFKISQALEDARLVDAMQEELLQFNIQKLWILVDLPYGKKAIKIKRVYRNKKDERGVVVKNKARLVGQGHRQEEGIDYDKVFALVARIEAIRIFLAFASYMGFIVYQMYVKSAFLYGTIDEEVYVSQLPGFVDHKYPKKVKQKEDGIFISQDKYVAEILKKFDLMSVKTASTLIETKKPLVKDEEAVDVDVHLYRSMIGSLMYLTASRPDIMFAVCACSRFQVTPKTSHLHAVKRIFRYLKGQPKLGLYTSANLDRKSTT
uniref:Ribonuclease H-like domain-containing protein n=1 Tax=Tanacetum cinerariifolium TaxID=118510 RepID=A0A699H545_TANCI|nr:ribonuclease H-like domain-containing protein [Tanacetum cinerariifolium]GEX28022.1 ribonuclease H-like domain-containing protein [Tanacetum cinerariifolium]